MELMDLKLWSENYGNLLQSKVRGGLPLIISENASKFLVGIDGDLSEPGTFMAFFID